MSLLNISNLRYVMKKKSLDGYIVPHNDENFSEYVPKNKERLNWISGFSGSAGTICNATTNYIYLLTGGIFYKLKNQTKKINCKIINIVDHSLLDFLKDNQNKFKNLGLESKTISFFEYNLLQNVISNNNTKIKIINKNIIDFLWKKKT